MESTRKTFGTGVIWNLLALGGMAFAGAGMTALILWMRSVAVLGYFQQILALYVILTHVATWGIHYSALHMGSSFAGDDQARNRSLTAAVLTVLCGSALVFIIVFWASPYFERLWQVQDMSEGIRLMTLALPVVALNKVLHSYVNGRGYLRVFAMANGIRCAGLLFGMWQLLRAGCPAQSLCLVFIISETAVFAYLALFLLIGEKFRISGCYIRDIKHHLSFGLRAAFVGVLLEANVRIDLLMLGIFASESVVGIYSIATLLIEGLYQLPVIVQICMVKTFAEVVGQRDEQRLRSIKRKAMAFMPPLVGAVAALVWLAYPLIGEYLFQAANMLDGRTAFAILAFGLALTSGYIVFHILLNQAGRPGLFSIFLMCSTATNCILNVLLIPRYGMNGAAFATALAMLLSAIYLHVIIRTVIKLRW